MCKTRKFAQELRSFFFYTSEQLVHIDPKRLLSERRDLFLFQNYDYTKTKHGINRQDMTCALLTIEISLCVRKFQFETHCMLVWSFSFQVSGEENSKHLNFITEA